MSGYELTLDVARRIGDVEVEVRCLASLAVLHRRRGELDEVRRLATEVLELPLATKAFVLYVASAHGNLAWAARREWMPIVPGKRAKPPGARSSCCARRPLSVDRPLATLGRETGAGDEADGVELARRLVDPSQMKLPDDLEAPLAGAVEAWDAGDATSAGDLLRTAVARAEESGWGWL